MNNASAKRYKARINLGYINNLVIQDGGSNPSESVVLREAIYRSNEVYNNFPLIFHPQQLDLCCEMNLFLMQRAKGEYSISKNQKKVSDAWSIAYAASLRGEPLDPKTIESISKDLKLFLDFLIENNLSYIEVISIPTESSDRDILPVWKYQKFLAHRVKNRELSWNTAQRMIGRIREFYVWSYQRGMIEKLPFDVEFKGIRNKKSNNYDLLFSVPKKNISKTYIQELISDLSIPKKFKQKSLTPDGLQPFSQEELISLLQTNVAKHRTYGLFLKCAYLAGLRSFEVVQINYSDVVNPEDYPKKSIFQINLVRKHHLSKSINISRNLMTELYRYTVCQDWLERRKKHEITFGMRNTEYPLPLFINRAGKRMAQTSPSDTIGEVRKEQRAKGKHVLNRSYHDLRATFGTYLALYLIQKLEDPRRVRATLRKWMGHEDFATTERYIDLAKAFDVSEYGEMHLWVEDIYRAVSEYGEDKL